MKHFVCACGFLLSLARPSVALYEALPLSFVTTAGRTNTAVRKTEQFPPTTHHHVGAGTPDYRIRSAWNTQTNSRRAERLRLSGTGSTVAPPPISQATRYGGGEDGVRVLTREESAAAVRSFAEGAKRHRRVEAEYKEYMGMLAGMRDWREGLAVKRMGCKRMILGNFKRGKLCCIAAAEVMWRGGLNRDVRICLRLIIVNPMYDTREIGFETVNEIKSFGTQNALLLDVSPLMAVPNQRIFCLASPKTLDEDPERVFKDPLIQQYYSRVRRSCYVLDGIPEWADLGPYWYEGALRDSVRFFFRKRLKAVNEYEVTLQRPGAGLSTGSGTVGGARVIPIDEAEASQDIPGHLKVREIERRLSSRLLEEMQGENPVLSD